MPIRVVILFVLLLQMWVSTPVWSAGGLNIVSSYSPLTKKRAKRTSTQYIILHTTEGPAKGSLNKLKRYGEAHYMLDTAGKVYRIVERNKIAMHCGRSMWNGKTNIDKHSIGIEIVGYHNKMPTEAQVRALKELLRQLQSIYKIPDQHVMPHSMVAYGRPNRWHRYSHRGRKRCAMNYARTSLRNRIGLTAKPSYDPDVRAGRLKNADATLAKILFSKEPARAVSSASRREPAHVSASGPNVIGAGRSAWDIARERYNDAATVYVFPDGSRKRGDEILRWHKIPKGTRVLIDQLEPTHATETETVQIIGRDGVSAQEIAGDLYNTKWTTYFLRNGQVRNGQELSVSQINALPNGTKMLVGYVYGGRLSNRRRAYDICGPGWNLGSTFYRFSDQSIRPGNQIDERKLPNGVMVFFPR